MSSQTDLDETLVERASLDFALARMPVIAGLPEETFAALAASVDWLSLPGGGVLFESGEDSDSLYFLVSGTLAVYAPPGSDRRRFVGSIQAGDIVGEMGLISGRARSATVVALRDSQLARLDRQGFQEVMQRCPQAMLRLAQLAVHRLERATSGERAPAQLPRSFALVPQDVEVDVGGFGIDFVAALERYGSAELVWGARGADHTSHWFHKIETANDFTVYVADHAATTWSKLCVRQADAVILLANAATPAGEFAAVTGARESRTLAKRSELVLLHNDGIQGGRAAQWCSRFADLPHHNIQNDADVRRLVRLLTGHACGLVLSGGGARGFAHIGMMRALREAGLEIDQIGGTSIGGIIAAGIACGWDDQELRERFYRSFVATNPLRDYTLPVVSLTSGRKVSGLLQREFGELDIESLPLPFFCVSSNLTTGRYSVHRRGRLAHWLRASVAIPGVLPPVMQSGEIYVDGGAMNNLPVDVMRESGRGPIIGCDVGNDNAFRASQDAADTASLWRMLIDRSERRRRPGLVRILWRAGMVNSAATTAHHRNQADFLLQPPLADIDLLNWKAFDQAVRAGYEYALAALDGPAGRALLERVHGEPTNCDRTDNGVGRIAPGSLG
ncbi:MAG: patatin-like phospholipase family protein [Steroidobacteraceae bacterium]